MVVLEMSSVEFKMFAVDPLTGPVTSSMVVSKTVLVLSALVY